MNFHHYFCYDFDLFFLIFCIIGRLNHLSRTPWSYPNRSSWSNRSIIFLCFRFILEPGRLGNFICKIGRNSPIFSIACISWEGSRGLHRDLKIIFIFFRNFYFPPLCGEGDGAIFTQLKAKQLKLTFHRNSLLSTRLAATSNKMVLMEIYTFHRQAL